MTTMAIVIAFALGFGARLIGLPPLIGFLARGFVLHALGQVRWMAIKAA